MPTSPGRRRRPHPLAASAPRTTGHAERQRLLPGSSFGSVGVPMGRKSRRPTLCGRDAVTLTESDVGDGSESSTRGRQSSIEDVTEHASAWSGGGITELTRWSSL